MSTFRIFAPAVIAAILSVLLVAALDLDEWRAGWMSFAVAVDAYAIPLAIRFLRR